MDITSSDVDINRMRQSGGMVFQQFNLFPNMTIRRNIMLAPVELGKMTRDEADEKATELLTRIEMCIRDRFTGCRPSNKKDALLDIPVMHLFLLSSSNC